MRQRDADRAAILQAAVYGRAFCSADAFPRDRIVAVCRQLRILNALRAPGVGLPLTAAQVGPGRAPCSQLMTLSSIALSCPRC